MTEFWTTYGFYLWLITLFGLLAAIGFTLRLASRVRVAVERYTTLTKGVAGETLEDIWQARSVQIATHDEHLTALDRQVNALARQSVQHVGVVRFNPFGDVGGDQSFAIALLDGDHNGFILSSIYSRSGVRTYAKFVQSGTSSHTLSDEEEAAIAQALGPALPATPTPALNPSTGGI